MELLSLVEAIGGGVRSPRNEQVRGSIPRGGSTALTWANSPGQSLLWTVCALPSLALCPGRTVLATFDLEGRSSAVSEGRVFRAARSLAPVARPGACASLLMESPWCEIGCCSARLKRLATRNGMALQVVRAATSRTRLRTQVEGRAPGAGRHAHH